MGETLELGKSSHKPFKNTWIKLSLLRLSAWSSAVRRNGENGSAYNDCVRREILRSTMDPRIEALIALMKADLRRMLPISRMAQSVNLSPTRLSCLFKAETGSPPARYLRQMRMQLAATLLVETFLSVKEIMARVGINDESHFVRDFKRITGMTPMQYRKQNYRDKRQVAGKH